MRNVDDDVERWLRNLDTAKQAAATLREAPGFIATPAAEKLFDAFSYAQHAPDLVVVSGAAGVGKTTAIGAYRARKPNVWVVTGEPCISTPRMMLDEIAELLGLSEGRSTHRISRSIVHANARHQGCARRGRGSAPQHARRSTSSAPFMTFPVWAWFSSATRKCKSRIDGGARKSEFAQIFSRVGMRVPMPKALRADIDALLDAWGIKGADERKLLAAIASRPGALRVMTKTIRIADMQAGAAEEASRRPSHQNGLGAPCRAEVGRRGMTPRQRQVLLTINDTIARTGVSPSTAEIGAALCLSSGVISDHLRKLIADGYIRRTRYGRAVRALEVVKLPGKGLTAVEAAWCNANPERVRAMMRLAGASATAPLIGPGDRDRASQGGSGDPGRHPANRSRSSRVRRSTSTYAANPRLRRRCYQRLSTVASRLWGPKGAVRRMHGASACNCSGSATPHDGTLSPARNAATSDGSSAPIAGWTHAGAAPGKRR